MYAGTPAAAALTTLLPFRQGSLKNARVDCTSTKCPLYAICNSSEVQKLYMVPADSEWAS